MKYESICFRVLQVFVCVIYWSFKNFTSVFEFPGFVRGMSLLKPLLLPKNMGVY